MVSMSKAVDESAKVEDTESRKSHTLTKLQDGLISGPNSTNSVEMKKKPTTSKNIIRIKLQPKKNEGEMTRKSTKTSLLSAEEEYERKLEMSKRKLQRGYADYEESRKRSRVVVLDAPSTSKAGIITNKGKEVGKAPHKKPSWWIRIQKERDAARLLRKVRPDIFSRHRPCY